MRLSGRRLVDCWVTAKGEPKVAMLEEVASHLHKSIGRSARVPEETRHSRETDLLKSVHDRGLVQPQVRSGRGPSDPDRHHTAWRILEAGDSTVTPVSKSISGSRRKGARARRLPLRVGGTREVKRLGPPDSPLDRSSRETMTARGLSGRASSVDPGPLLLRLPRQSPSDMRGASEKAIR